MNYKKNKNQIGNVLSMPLIWLPLPFLMILDLFIEIYHRICFPIYGIEYVKRSEYIRVWDRAKLKYLGKLESGDIFSIFSYFERLGCMYCGYANGALPYFKEIANRTEKYWCGVKHADEEFLKGHEHHQKLNFTEYGDEDGFEKEYNSRQK